MCSTQPVEKFFSMETWGEDLSLGIMSAECCLLFALVVINSQVEVTLD